MSDPLAVQPTTSSPATKAKIAGLGMISLTAIIISSMIGGGAFSLPQNMTSGASAGAIVIAWVITGIGMWFIVHTFRILADARPELTNGLYTYAEAGFGKFAGFLIGYGYWISNCFAVVAYSVLTLKTIEYFIPAVGRGHNVPAILLGSVFIWGITAITLMGARRASFVNAVGTVSKLIPIVIFIILMAAVFRFSAFALDFWGTGAHGAAQPFSLHSVLPQVKSTMMVTLWVFIGIEGAVVVSGRARSQTLVRKSTTLAFAGTLAIYALVSLLPLGTYSQAKLGAMSSTGSMAYVMADRFGHWGAILVNIGIIISVADSWLAWMVLLGEIPQTAARRGSFPQVFARENRHHAPHVSLLVTAVVIEAFFLFTFFAKDAWSVMLTLTGVVSLPPYFFCTLFLAKIGADGSYPKKARSGRWAAFWTGAMGSVYGLWLMYAAGLQYLMAACFIFLIGVPIYIAARKKQAGGHALFSFGERIVLVVVLVLGAAGLVYTIVNWSTLVGG